jgi:hypothetical protein
MIFSTNLAFSINIPSQPDIEKDSIMSWNYRVIYLPKDPNDDSFFNNDSFVIREVYYNDAGEIEFWAEEDALLIGETFEELCDDFDLMQEAFEKPILMLTEEDGVGELVALDDEEEDEDEED